jgi:ribosome-binding protein aMBF1 (putative translation factor)
VEVVSFRLDMARPRARRGRQERAKGPAEWIDKAWQDAVRAEMTRQGWEQKDLAKEAKLSRGAVSGALKLKPEEPRRQIRCKTLIEKALGMRSSEERDADLRTVNVRWPDLPAVLQDAIMAIVESAAKPSGDSSDGSR